jgi:hypothetical protein
LAEQKVVKMQNELTTISSAILEHSQSEDKSLKANKRELMDVKIKIDSSANQLKTFDKQLQRSIKKHDLLMEKIKVNKE